MSEIRRLQALLESTFSGPNSWHGPSVTDALAGVTAARAARQPMPQAHSIWELVLHMTTWREEVCRYFEEGRYGPVSDERNFPQVGDVSDEAWKEAVDRLQQSQQRLVANLQELSEEDLGRQVEDNDCDCYLLLHGIIHHDLYHAGQINLLKKAA